MAQGEALIELVKAQLEKDIVAATCCRYAKFGPINPKVRKFPAAFLQDGGSEIHERLGPWLIRAHEVTIIIVGRKRSAVSQALEELDTKLYHGTGPLSLARREALRVLRVRNVEREFASADIQLRPPAQQSAALTFFFHIAHQAQGD